MSAAPAQHLAAQHPLGRVAFVLAVALCACGLAWAILAVPLLPTNDGPQHLYAGYVAAHIDDPLLGLHDVVDTNTPLTARFVYELIAVLCAVTDPFTAHQLVLVGLCELWAFGVLALVLAHRRARAPLGLLGFGTALQWALYIGLLPFLLACAIGVWMLAFAVRVRAPARVWHVAVLAALFWLQASAHVLPAVVTGALLCAHAAGVTAHRLRAVAGVCIAAIPAAAIALLTRGTFTDAHGGTRRLAPTDTLLLLLDRFQPGPVWRVALWGALLCGCGLLAAARVRSLERPHRALLAAAALGMLFTLALPFDAPGWQLVQPRPLPLLCMVLVAAAPLESVTRWARGAVFAVAFTYSAACILNAQALHERLWRDVKEPLEALATLPVQHTRWSLALLTGDAGRNPAQPEPTVPELVPTFHLPQVVATRVGGAADHGQDFDRAIHAIWGPQVQTLAPSVPQAFRTDAWPMDIDTQDRAERVQAYLARFFAAGRVLVYAEPGDWSAVQAAGFVVRMRVPHGNKEVGVVDFVGCRATLQVWSDGDEITLYVGQPTAGSDALDGPIDAIVVRGDATLALRPLPCTTLWFVTDDVPCAEAQGADRMLFTLASDAPNVITCHLEGAGP